MNESTILCIGTTHPWNVAGTGRDAQVAADHHVRALTVITGITAQDAGGIREKFAIPAPLVRAQLQSVSAARYGVMRIGAVFAEENVREIARFLGTRLSVPAVVDPVFGATLGGAFASDATYETFVREILPQRVILTPNIPEAERFLARSIATVDDMRDAAHALLQLGPQAVLLKGGHLPGAPVDILLTREREERFTDARLPGTMRGTGCTLAAALACELANGKELFAAVESARKYVRNEITNMSS
ncbi:MAG: hydroxymethylpyrimidine/phosphomethylpyrimidine kinase [Candidatus Eremiobacteraeota bacterium]|nr:hydroxymethylpyrimidine/phosphomethylpyrimidine kinase [Candidatus Eremiobacteraeota bacterium]